MKTVSEAKTIDGVVDPKHEIEIVCAHCGYDLDESELEADTCSDCGATLSLRQSTTIYATSVPSATGDASL
jgi:DNA-directed RNA polymerase subunit RPC12/RpoP|tara:strand:+ start:727 stop:939 length:213 start_codon:yes stop_codon:yes gene_type:complete